MKSARLQFLQEKKNEVLTLVGDRSIERLALNIWAEGRFDFPIPLVIL
jgi:hypothetical protein